MATGAEVYASPGVTSDRGIRSDRLPEGWACTGFALFIDGSNLHGSLRQASLGRQVQVVLNTHIPTGGVPYAFADDSGQMSFQMSDGDTCLQIFAPDLQSLRAAAAAIRPGLTAELEQSINHPSTPQMEPAPTK